MCVMTRRIFLRNLGIFFGAMTVGLTVTRPQRAFRKDYYKTVTIRGPDNSVLVGYKGSEFLEAGYVYAPYIPIYRTPNILHPEPIRLTRNKNLLQLF